MRLARTPRSLAQSPSWTYQGWMAFGVPPASVSTARVSRMLLPGTRSTFPLRAAESAGPVGVRSALHDWSGTVSPDASSTTRAGGWTHAVWRNATTTNETSVGLIAGDSVHLQQTDAIEGEVLTRRGSVAEHLARNPVRGCP